MVHNGQRYKSSSNGPSEAKVSLAKEAELEGKLPYDPESQYFQSSFKISLIKCQHYLLSNMNQMNTMVKIFVMIHIQ